MRGEGRKVARLDALSLPKPSDSARSLEPENAVRPGAPAEGAETQDEEGVGDPPRHDGLGFGGRFDEALSRAVGLDDEDVSAVHRVNFLDLIDRNSQEHVFGQLFFHPDHSAPCGPLLRRRVRLLPLRFAQQERGAAPALERLEVGRSRDQHGHLRLDEFDDEAFRDGRLAARAHDGGHVAGGETENIR